MFRRVLALIGLTSGLGLASLPTTPGPVNPLPAGSATTGELPAPNIPDAAQVGQAGKDGGGDKPDYSGLTTYLFHFPDIRLETLAKGKIPYLSVMNTAVMAEHQKHLAECQQARQQQGGDTSACPPFEWIVPYSLASGSVTAATGLRRAWQRFEDRYYWRAVVQLNNPAMYLSNCLINLNVGLQTQEPAVRITVAPGDVTSQAKLTNKYPFNTFDNQLYLDSYLPFPQVENTDYCSGLSFNFIPEIPFMYLPGTCFTFLGAPTGICLEGDKSNAVNPLAPAPLYFNMPEAQNRVRQAVEKAQTTYLTEYQSDVVKALFNTKNKYFFPLPWRSLVPGDGAVIAPLMNTAISPKPFTDLAKLVSDLYKDDKDTKLYALNSYPYYFQSVYRSPTLDAHLLPKRYDVLGTPPGVWLFEEYKRLLPVTNLPFQEQLGYTTFFEAFNEFKTTLLPELTYAKFLRPVLYYASGNLYDLVYQTVIPLPQPMRVPQYSAGLPYAGVQSHFDWKSVPEGYQIPRVKGTPLFDYGAVVR